MGYRTYLLLEKPGEIKFDTDIAYNFETKLVILNNYCLGKVYFNDLPEPLYDKHIPAIWFNADGAESGEMTVAVMLDILNDLKTVKMQPTEDTSNPWWKFSWHDLKEKLDFLVEQGKLSLDDYITFSVF